jgi:protein SCO1/2
MPLNVSQVAGVFVAGVLAGLAGCAKAEHGSTPATAQKRYSLTGQVQSTDPGKRTIRLTHDAVDGLMPAMTMDFPASPGDLGTVHPGEHIRADLVIDHPGAEPRLEKIWPDDRQARADIAAGQKALREDTHDRGTEAYREVGEAIPEFSLYDQSGQVIHSGQFRGKQVMLNFIYSRCPSADMCPAATAKMMMAQRLAAKAGVRNIQFVSITLDPVFDTPGVLKEYAEARSIDTSNFSFLTGPDGAVRDLLTQFGVLADFSDGIVKHTLTTLLIDARGKIIWRADGSQWDPADFVARMHKS